MELVGEEEEVSTKVADWGGIMMLPSVCFIQRLA